MATTRREADRQRGRRGHRVPGGGEADRQHQLRGIAGAGHRSGRVPRTRGAQSVRARQARPAAVAVRQEHQRLYARVHRPRHPRDPDLGYADTVQFPSALHGRRSWARRVRSAGACSWVPLPRVSLHPDLRLLRPQQVIQFTEGSRTCASSSAAPTAPVPPWAAAWSAIPGSTSPSPPAARCSMGRWSSTAGRSAAPATIARWTSKGATTLRSVSLGGNAQLGSGIRFVLGLTAKSGFIFGDAGPFFTELYSMGGTQYGVPLRGYEEFSITPNGFDPTAGGIIRGESQVLRQILRGLHGGAGCPGQPVAVLQRLLRRRQRVPD